MESQDLVCFCYLHLGEQSWSQTNITKTTRKCTQGETHICIEFESNWNWYHVSFQHRIYFKTSNPALTQGLIMTPHLSKDFHLSPYNHHWIASLHTINQHLQPRWTQVHIWGPSDMRWRTSRANVPSSWKPILTITQVTQTIFQQQSSNHSTTGFTAFIEWYHHAPINSYQPTLSSMSTTPKTISFGRTNM